MLKYAHTGETTGLCWQKRGEQLADHYHIFWSCTVILPSWWEKIRALPTILGREVDFLVQLCNTVSNLLIHVYST